MVVHTNPKLGKFIVFGGLDHTGKTTQAKHLQRYLEEKGIPSILTHEPGGTLLGAEIKKLFLSNESQEWSPKAQYLLYMAAREEHLEKVIRPALEKGIWVITDRFFESSYLYQGAKGLSDSDFFKLLYAANHHDPYPDHTLLFTGKIESLRSKDVWDQYCESHYDIFQQRLHRFAEMTNNVSSVIDVTHKSEDQVFREVLACLNV